MKDESRRRGMTNARLRQGLPASLCELRRGEPAVASRSPNVEDPPWFAVATVAGRMRPD